MPPFPAAPAPKPDERQPDQMPVRGNVEWFDRSRGFGVLITTTNERVAFNGEVYTRAAQGADAGAPVDLVWKRARAGAWNVPAAVTQVGYKPAAPPPSFSLAAWLAGFQERSTKLKGMTRARLVAASDSDLEPWVVSDGATHRFGSGTRDDAWLIFDVLGELPPHERWIRSFDYKDFDGGFALLPAMVGLTLDDLLATGAALDDFIPACNRLARTDERLFSLHTGGDNYMVIAMPSDECARLVDDGYLRLDTGVAPAAPPPSLAKRFVGWLAATVRREPRPPRRLRP